jgi:hypothetical protein
MSMCINLSIMARGLSSRVEFFYGYVSIIERGVYASKNISSLQISVKHKSQGRFIKMTDNFNIRRILTPRPPLPAVSPLTGLRLISAENNQPL